MIARTYTLDSVEIIPVYIECMYPCDQDAVCIKVNLIDTPSFHGAIRLIHTTSRSSLMLKSEKMEHP